MACEVCGGDGLYPIHDMHGRERFSIQCPECFGAGRSDEEIVDDQRRHADLAGYNAAMAEMRERS